MYPADSLYSTSTILFFLSSFFFFSNENFLVESVTFQIVLAPKINCFHQYPTSYYTVHSSYDGGLSRGLGFHTLF